MKYKHTHTHTHTHTVFVENPLTRELAEKLFVVMDTKEIQTGEDSEKWVKHLLSGVVDEL